MVGGHGSLIFGCRSVEEIKSAYSASPLSVKEPLILDFCWKDTGRRSRFIRGRSRHLEDGAKKSGEHVAPPRPHIDGACFSTGFTSSASRSTRRSRRAARRASWTFCRWSFPRRRRSLRSSGIAWNIPAEAGAPARGNWTGIGCSGSGRCRTWHSSVSGEGLAAQTTGWLSACRIESLPRLAFEHDRCGAMGAGHRGAATNCLGFGLHGAPAFRALDPDQIGHSALRMGRRLFGAR